MAFRDATSKSPRPIPLWLVAIATRHPDRVAGIVLMGAAGRSEFQLTKGLEEVWGYEPSLDNMRALMNTFAHDASLVKEEIVKSRYEASIRPGAHEKYSSLFPEPRQRWLTELSTSDDRLARLHHQVLMVHGREDVIVPVACSIRFNEVIPNSELHIFGNCGHWTQIEMRDRFIELVTPFLKRIEL